MKKSPSLNDLKENIIPPLENELAPGWPILLTLMIILLCYLALFIYTRHRKNLYRRKGLSELSKIENLWVTKKDKAPLKEIPLILKKVAYHFAPQSSSLSGEAWQQFLHQTQAEIKPTAFQILASLSYEKDEVIHSIPEQDLQSLIEDAKLWVRTHRLPEGELA